MAIYKLIYGTTASFPLVSNLTSLSNNTAKPLGEVDNSSARALDATVFVQVALNASGVSSSGTVELYLLEKDAGPTAQWTDGISPSATTDQVANLKNAKLLEVLAANANSQVVRFQFRLADYISTAPQFWTLLVLNKSGATAAASGHSGTVTSVFGSIE